MRSGDETLNGKAFSEAFLRENPGVRSVIELFEHLPFVLFYSKDAQQRYVAVNPRTLMANQHEQINYVELFTSSNRAGTSLPFGPIGNRKEHSLFCRLSES